jgi:hypothetical protein
VQLGSWIAEEHKTVFTCSINGGCRSRSIDDMLVYITYFWEMLAFQVSFCRFIICNNKSQLLLHPYMPSQLINLKNQLRYRLLNMWKLFCVPLLSSFLVALAVVRRKKIWKARLIIMRILLFFENLKKKCLGWNFMHFLAIFILNLFYISHYKSWKKQLNYTYGITLMIFT